MTGFFEIFQSGLQFKREQDDLEKILVVDADKGGSGPQPLDLDSGSVTLRVPARQPAADLDPAQPDADPGDAP